MPEPTNIATEAADDDLDLRQCEHCDKSFPIETMTMMEDCWFCEACAKEWRAIFDACAHEWRPYTDSMGDEGRICDRCNGFVAHEDAEAVLGTPIPESPAVTQLLEAAAEIATLRASLAAANARCERMRVVLERFAKRWNWSMTEISEDCIDIQIDCRAARDAADETGEGRG